MKLITVMWDFMSQDNTNSFMHFFEMFFWGNAPAFPGLPHGYWILAPPNISPDMDDFSSYGQSLQAIKSVTLQCETY